MTTGDAIVIEIKLPMVIEDFGHNFEPCMYLLLLFNLYCDITLKCEHYCLAAASDAAALLLSCRQYLTYCVQLL